MSEERLGALLLVVFWVLYLVAVIAFAWVMGR